MVLQLGVRPSWFNTCSTTIEKRPHLIPGAALYSGDLRNYMIELPPVGDSVVPEMLLKILEPYRKEGGSFVLFVVFPLYILVLAFSDLLLMLHCSRLHN